MEIHEDGNLVTFIQSDPARRQVSAWTLQGQRLPKICCSHCNAAAIYADRFDALLCPHCNRWLESACNDAGCEFCPGRPPQPFAA